jgi:hypothetical protein
MTRNTGQQPRPFLAAQVQVLFADERDFIAISV